MVECLDGKPCVNFDDGPSRLDLYYNARSRENKVCSNVGTSITSGIQGLFYRGVCPEKMWPYNLTKFAIKPPESCNQQAITTAEDISNMRVEQSVHALKSAIAQRYSVIVGISVYENFWCASGMISLPKVDIKGGHALLLLGYDDSLEAFMFSNSWGRYWGNEGYCMIPYRYLADFSLAFDFWTIRRLKSLNS